MSNPPSLPRFFSRGESKYERELRERCEKTERDIVAIKAALVDMAKEINQLDADDCEIEQTLSSKIELVRKMTNFGSLNVKPAEGEEMPNGVELFTQRRAKALRKSSATQQVAERIAKAVPPPKEQDNGN